MGMISFLLCLAILPPCHLLLDSCLLGLTLRPSAPVFVATGFLGHAGGWHLRRMPCVLPIFFLDFSAPFDFCKVIQAVIEKCLFMRCGNVMALQIRDIVFGVSHNPGAYTVLDHLFWARLSALKNHDVLLHCVWFHCLTTTNR